jgi:hypothetical protein
MEGQRQSQSRFCNPVRCPFDFRNLRAVSLRKIVLSGSSVLAETYRLLTFDAVCLGRKEFILFLAVATEERSESSEV